MEVPFAAWAAGIFRHTVQRRLFLRNGALRRRPNIPAFPIGSAIPKRRTYMLPATSGSGTIAALTTRIITWIILLNTVISRAASAEGTYGGWLWDSDQVVIYEDPITSDGISPTMRGSEPTFTSNTWAITSPLPSHAVESHSGALRRN